jgi:hypothetical protein
VEERVLMVLADHWAQVDGVVIHRAVPFQATTVAPVAAAGIMAAAVQVLAVPAVAAAIHPEQSSPTSREPGPETVMSQLPTLQVLLFQQPVR